MRKIDMRIGTILSFYVEPSLSYVMPSLLLGHLLLLRLLPMLFQALLRLESVLLIAPTDHNE
jgi:hypothetical protein